jgi:hypothetical protein
MGMLELRVFQSDSAKLMAKRYAFLPTILTGQEGEQSLVPSFRRYPH